MIRIFITAVLYLISFFSQAQGPSNQKESINLQPTVSITTTVKHLNSDKGAVYFALYQSEEDFMSRKYFQAKKSLADKNGVSVVFEGIPQGVYAISCYYDENDNGKMDFDQNGMPLEDYGSSNNVTHYGPPRFSDAKFVVNDKDLTFEIKF